MDTYPDPSMERFHKTLKIAMKNEALLMIMDTLVKMAEVMIDKGEKERAVEILTIAMQYPMRQATRTRAESLYSDLESEVCPRVILDAKTLAEEITLDDLMEAILGRE
ncbi:MAG: hypothetical protein J0L63_09025 [Anaerolineae bacterium]|mgnify:CR=1 FL=1|nr:hypothetical protein [Anaerolineae bacterium]MBN8619037.1 hypothetical protein [Anaerolineae bacterium]